MSINNKKARPEPLGAESRDEAHGRRVYVGMSGGVDSSVAAALLKKQGYDVIGVHIKCYNIDGCGERDAEDARHAAEVLHVPFYVFDFEKEYKDKVVTYMVDGYRKGITPNPDVMCNKEIKFGLFFKKARSLGADFVATGHYVRLVKSRMRQETSKLNNMSHFTCNYSLYTAKDKNKDQSYFLWTLTQAQLKHCLFPIGDYIKPDVRKIAKKYKLPNADKKDSQGICFLGRVKLGDFLNQYIKPRVGQVRLAQRDGASMVIGEHNGAHLYTIGQRHGLKIGGFKKPLYVAEKDAKTNTILVAEGEKNPALYRNEIKLKNMNFINPTLPSLMSAKGGQARLSASDANRRIDVFMRVRYRQPLFSATLKALPNGSWQAVFAVPQKFVAKGQSAVFYVNENPSLPSVHSGHSTLRVSDSMRRRSRALRMLGGGIIV